jgi:hypothetical protein
MSFQLSLLFVGKVGAYQSKAPFWLLLALPTNIKLEWKDLSRANTLVYYEYP